MKKRLIIVFALALVMVLSVVLAACNPTEEVEYFSITFDAQNDTTPVVVKYDDKFQMPEDPVKDGFVFEGWYTNPSCTKEWIPQPRLLADITLYANWVDHIHDFDGNYLMFTTCKVEGCNVVGRTKSTHALKYEFNYNFNKTKKSTIDDNYNSVLAAIDGNSYETLEELFIAYDDDVSYVVEQYQYAYVFYCAYEDEIYTTQYEEISEYYNQSISRYYGLFRPIYESKFKDEFFEGWTEEEIQEALILSDNYGDSRYTELKDQIDALVLEYDEMIANGEKVEKFSEPYARLVELNNNLAKLAGYDNYMEYAYANEYDRDYTPEDVATMRNYVKKYIVPVLNSVSAYFNSFSGFSSTAAQNYYMGLAAESVFKNTANAQSGANAIGNYLKQLVDNSGSKEVDFFEQANLLFKNGNYYVGPQSGAYTYWIPNKQTSILFFSDEKSSGYYNYQNAFTFIHEFGHYYNGVHNSGLSLTMDLKEIQSQGNEMLFLAWLGDQRFTNKTSQGFEALMHEQLANILTTICIATAVDEFEQAAYTGEYNGQPIGDDYSALFTEIVKQYGSNVSRNKDYWSYVVFDQCGYYISYAMSALPAVELYCQAKDAFGVGKQNYLKLFTFSDNPELVETNEDGSRTVIATCEQILNYCGLQGPFQEGLYTTIRDYFK